MPLYCELNFSEVVLPVLTSTRTLGFADDVYVYGFVRVEGEEEEEEERRQRQPLLFQQLPTRRRKSSSWLWRFSRKRRQRE